MLHPERIEAIIEDYVQRCLDEMVSLIDST